MKKLLLVAASVLLWNVSPAQDHKPTPKAATYGQEFSEASVWSPGRLPMLMSEKDRIENFQIAGYVSEVCQKEGCWLKMTTNPNSNDAVFVKMKDHAFAVPKDITGKMIVVQGTAFKKSQSVAEQKHYLEDAGASQEKIDEISSPKTVYEVQAIGVRVY